jgi:hypothetical protein
VGLLVKALGRLLSARFMTLLIIVGILVGAITVSRFRVIAVVPLTAFMLGIVFLVGILHGDTAWWMAAVTAASVQWGYLGGSVWRLAVSAKRSPSGF